MTAKEFWNTQVPTDANKCYVHDYYARKFSHEDLFRFAEAYASLKVAEAIPLEDLKQYMTNLLYYAYDEGNKGIDGSQFDKWVEQRVGEIREYFKSEKSFKVSETTKDKGVIAVVNDEEKKQVYEIEKVLQKFVTRCKYGISSSDISLAAQEIAAKTAKVLPIGEADRDDAEDFLSTKDIWNHPRITDRCDKESYEVADLMAEFATAWFRYRMGDVHPIFKNHGTQINDADDEHPTNK